MMEKIQKIKAIAPSAKNELRFAKAIWPLNRATTLLNINRKDWQAGLVSALVVSTAVGGRHPAQAKSGDLA